MTNDPGFDPDVVATGTVTLNRRLLKAYGRDGGKLPLTAAEFAALALLFDAAGAVVSPETMTVKALRRPWNGHFDGGARQLVFQLRRKLPPDEDGDSMVRSLRCQGWWMPRPAAPRELAA